MMKILAKLLLIGTIVATAIFFWQKNWRSAGQYPVAQQKSDSTLASITPSLEPSPVPVQIKQTNAPSHFIPNVSSNSFENTLASLRSKLHRWQESTVKNPDDEDGREQLLKEMLAMVTDENVAEIIQSLSTEEMNTSFGTGALHRWMQADPVTASNWLAARPDTTQEQTMAVAEDWNKNRDGLKQYLDQLPDTAWKQNFLQAASSDMTFKDPIAAVKLAQQMKPGDAQTDLLRSVACGWVSTDPNAALDWIASVKDPSLREQLVASAAQSYALTDPAQAMAWLASSVKSDQITKDSALNIIQTWVTKDPASAAKLVDQFPAGDTREAAVQIVSSYWQQTDPEAAATWIQNLSGEPPTSTY